MSRRSDAARRERYDRTGQTDEDSQSFADAYERYRGVPITEDDIGAYLSTYRESEAEQNDLVAYFEAHGGDVSHILGAIVGSGDADVPRFVKFFKAALRSGKARHSLAATLAHACEDPQRSSCASGVRCPQRARRPSTRRAF